MKRTGFSLLFLYYRSGGALYTVQRVAARCNRMLPLPAQGKKENGMTLGYWQLAKGERAAGFRTKPGGTMESMVV